MKKTIFRRFLKFLPVITLFLSSQVFAACDPCTACGSCVTANTPLVSTLNQCLGEGKSATKDSYAAGEACGRSQIIGRFVGSAKTAGAPLSLDSTTEHYGVKTIADEIKEYGGNTTNMVEKRSVTILKAYSTFNTNMLSAISSSVTSMNQLNTETEENNLKARMEYESDLIATGIREGSNGAGTGTQEEIKFILNELKNSNTEHTSVVITAMKEKYDNNDDFIIPVRYKHTENLTANSGCEEYNPEENGDLSDYSCYKGQNANPGKTLEIYFKECSISKSRELTKLQSQASSNVQEKESVETSNSNFNSLSSSQAVINQQLSNEIVACSGEQVAMGSCKLRESYNSSDEYRTVLINDIIENKIIVNGSTSSLNLLTPTIIGSFDGALDLTDEEYETFLAKAGEVGEVSVSTNTPKLVNTYKTSSQYISSKSFANNIVSEGIVSNVGVQRRNNMSDSLFASGFKQRQAMLNLSKMSFAETIAARTGKVISEKVNSGELNYLDDIIKEDINGAGKIDVISHDIEKNFESVMSDFHDGSGDLNAKIYETEVHKARLSLNSYLHWNRIELLLASKVVEQVNNPKEKEFIKKLKNN